MRRFSSVKISVDSLCAGRQSTRPFIAKAERQIFKALRDSVAIAPC
jgi:hypothetical protein